VSRVRGLLMVLLVVGTGSAACSDGASDVAPPNAAAPSGAAPSGTATNPVPSAETVVDPAEDAATAVGDYLREQALAVNAGTSDAARLPAFTATLTPAAQEWALPLLAANLGDRMPGPYPSRVRGGTVVSADRVELSLCLQDRGWQTDATGRPVNAAHFATARAVVVRVGERWLVDDLAADGGQCSAADVDVERF
jgi:hypothetical protein